MNSKIPLAEQMRPKALEDVVGQEHLFGQNGALSVISRSKNVPSMILWGPPGVGKTTIAKALAQICQARFVSISAINSGAAEIRKVVDFARKCEEKTLLMVDEIHHFNKTQQDLFLPFVEDGTIILVGTTTENPSFELNSALLSRCKILTLKNLQEDDLKQIVQNVEKKLGQDLPIDEEARESLIVLACGDARYLLNSCEELFASQSEDLLNKDQLYDIISQRAVHFDKKGDFHYGLISAFHKSLRGSDVDAALYYLTRMLAAKESPHYILRRLARFATEDIGMADPNALLQVMAAKDNYDFLGSPEGDYAISHAVIYCATAPKSNASYMAHKEAMAIAKKSTNIMPPKNILNAPTKMMKNEGFGDGYIYDHDDPDCFSGQEFFPDEIVKNGRPEFFRANERGFERDLSKRLKYWDSLRKKKRG